MRKCLLLVFFALLIAGTAYGDFVYEYTQDTGNRCRGIAIISEDDAFASIAAAPRAAQWYFDMPDAAGAFDCERQTFVLDALNYTYSYDWGAGIHDGLIYHAVQDPVADDAYILVWDDSCPGTEVDYLLIGMSVAGSEYPTACDCDAAGNVYMAVYIDGAVFDQITVYPPRTSWVAHTATPLTSLETGAFVCEGLCVTQDGSTIYSTNRSAPGTDGWCKKFDGTPTTGYTEDLGFVCPVGGYVRAVEVDETNGRVFVCQDGGSPNDGLVIICDAFTGAHLDTIVTTDIGPDNASPYDLEWDEVGQDLYVDHYYGWFIDKYHWEPLTAVTMSSFEAIGATEQVELTWRVESEYDNAGYRIFRDGSPIAFVEGRGNTETALTYTWIDKDVTAGTVYRYRIADVDLDGRETMHDFIAEATPKPAAGGQVPTSYALYQNYPNPFNADTHIRFTLAEAGNTTLKIYNTTGQVIATLVDGHMDARTHEVRWDGRNANGEMVASGIYFYRLSSGNFAETKKMSFLR